MFINNVQATLLQSARVSEMHFLAICRPEFQKKIYSLSTLGISHEDCELRKLKKLNLLGKTAIDESAWIKAYLLKKSVDR